jgi:hypothetical protein
MMLEKSRKFVVRVICLDRKLCVILSIESVRRAPQYLNIAKHVALGVAVVRCGQE